MTAALCHHRIDLHTGGSVRCLSADVSEEILPVSACDACAFNTAKLPATTESKTYPKPPMQGVGDVIAAGLSAVGIKKQKGCGCGSRQAKLNRLLPFPGSRHDKRWAVAVTTAPRVGCTVINCINSLRSAGWEPVAFAEPGSHDLGDVETIANPEKLGLWHNWLQSANWCLEHTRADWILTVQDDVVFHPESKSFVESLLWPSRRCGFLSLYTPRHYQLKAGNPEAWGPGVRRIRTGNLWGACALIWPRPVLQQLVSHPIARSWQGVMPKRGKAEARAARKADPSLINNSDTAIGRILNRMRREMWFVDPSLAEHVSLTSTVGHGSNTGRRNCYRCADCDRPIRDQVPMPDDFTPHQITA